MRLRQLRAARLAHDIRTRDEKPTPATWIDKLVVKWDLRRALIRRQMRLDARAIYRRMLDGEAISDDEFIEMLIGDPSIAEELRTGSSKVPNLAKEKI